MNKKVVFPELEVVEFEFCSSAKCGTKCYFFAFGFLHVHNCVDCARIALSLTGVDCEGGYIFKKKESWETCTRENTKVGDEVREITTRHTEYGLATVCMFLKNNPSVDVVVVYTHNSRHQPDALHNYEININR